MAKKENQYLVTFNKPYTFECKEYSVLDLSGMEDLRTSQIKEAHREFASEGQFNPRPEVDLGYCCTIASMVCGLPREFFDDLPARDGSKVRNMVQNFFLVEDGAD